MNDTKKLLSDLEQLQWARDIESWDHWKNAYDKGKLSKPTEKFILRRLHEIQARWPQFIKPSEIPE